jgi:isopenicillin N synthase-like dioxygenase
LAGRDELNLKQCVKKCIKHFEQTGQNLLKSTALYLGLPEDYFGPKVHNGNSILRLLHYYPVADKSHKFQQEQCVLQRMEISTLITLLMGGSAEGLQAQSLDGHWINVSPKEDEIVVNIGDMLARLTNDKLRSTQHQVITPNEASWLTPRFSTPFFMHPRSDMDLTCLEKVVFLLSVQKHMQI